MSAARHFESNRTTSRHVALLLAISALTFFLNLGVPRLWDRDEPRNAGASLEMLRRGDWIVPTFNGELRVHKPVLINWFMMSAFAVFDDPEFAARFWSAALAAGAVLMTYAIGRRLFNASAAFWAGVVLASNLQFAMLARAATPEMLFTFFLTASMLAYVLGTFRRGDPFAEAPEPPMPRDNAVGLFPSWPVAAGMFALMGVAVLAKGPAGLVLPTAVVGLFLLVMRLPRQQPADAAPAPWWRRVTRATASIFAPRHFLRTAWSMRPITALLAAGIVALPWYIAVAQRTHGEWVRRFIIEHNLGRAAHPMEGHGGSRLMYPLTVLFFYPLTIIAGLLPWSLILVPVGIDAVKRVRRRDPWHDGYVFLACWAGVYLAAFSLVRTKLPSYMTPIYPALALAVGCFVHHWVRGSAAVPKKSVTDALRLTAGVGVGIVIGIPLAVWVVRSLSALRPEAWIGLMGLVPVAGAILALRAVRRGDVAGASRAFGVTAVAVTVAVFGIAVVRVDLRIQHSGPVLEAITARSAAPRIATFNRLEPTWVFYSGTTLPEFKATSDAIGFLASGPDAFIITSGDHLSGLRSALPPGVGVVAEVPYFGRTEPIYVIGHQTSGDAPTVASSATPRPERKLAGKATGS
jgi:4-amino-4-deoxy-L-arabinose transferase-like glycosyltransferase